ncbi:hypothetical protein GCM10009557_11510 [Virgisporangium ochraceum]|uniref:Uncharacterized protein n=1 Tax=Virgisporangium ochraceum TaxID=65505 RepID=A0A8J3ZWS8_9ACTN|nr:hypothetical protein Voc01_048170 [Virgisporangium ochraceum]
MNAPTRTRLTDPCWRCDDSPLCRPVALVRRHGHRSVRAWYRCSLGHVWRADWSGAEVNDADLAAAVPEQPCAVPAEWPEVAEGRAVVLACDGCHASAAQLGAGGHVGACRWPGRHNHPVAQSVTRCPYLLETLEMTWNRSNTHG